MRNLILLLGAADSVESVRAMLDAAEPADLAELGEVCRRASDPQPAAEYPIPGPYDIALAFGAAAVAAGKHENIGAAMAAAWFAVPEFYIARDEYLRTIAPIFAGKGLGAAASPPEGGDDAETPPV